MGDLVKMLPSPLWLIGTIALAAGGIFYSLVVAELKSAAGRTRLRDALEAGGHWRRLYIQLLTPSLNWLDRFLRDADKASFSLPSPFGNREAYPYWTGWSFDRCALLALVYPLLSLIAVWVWTGESGPIAEWLGMKHGAAWWSRLLDAASVDLICFAYWRSLRASGWRSLAWLLTWVLAVAAAASYYERRNLLGRFWMGYWPIVCGLCYIGLIALVRVDAGPMLLSFLLMVALVPITKIPFDWASIGLTRALLRRGVEAGAPSPVILGFVDFLFGLLLLVILAVVLIAALQAADAVIVRFGGNPVAEVVALLDKIDSNPRDPAQYWAYATLFSTLIPSILNAVIGAVSLIGWWWRPAREGALTLLAQLDRDENDEGIRWRVSAVLAAQVGLGTALTCLVFWGLWELLLLFPSVFPFVIAPLKQFALAVA